MQTFRKLPIAQPKTNIITDQRWNGTADQTSRSKVADMISVAARVSARLMFSWSAARSRAQLLIVVYTDGPYTFCIKASRIIVIGAVLPVQSSKAFAP